MTAHVQLYDTAYRRFALSARRQVKAKTYGQDIGQNSWLSRDEWDSALDWLVPTPQAHARFVQADALDSERHLSRYILLVTRRST